MTPVIILGAGASYDYIDSSQDNHAGHMGKPPLTADLFNVRYENFLKKYPDVGRLASDIYTRQYLKFEDYLTTIKDTRAAKDAGRQRQLVALEYYLQDLFKNLSELYGFQPTNNYAALIQRINDLEVDGNGGACFINFNYDILLEQNITSIQEHVDSYISGPIKVIKPHGSCEWRYILNRRYTDITSSYDFLMKQAWYSTMPENQMAQIYYKRMNFNNWSYFDDEIYLYPAVAIPLANKQHFICPEDHINQMVEAIKNTDRVLVIGWRAGDMHLLQILKENLPQKTKVKIVSHNIDSAKETRENMKKYINVNFDVSKQQTFSHFMKSSESVEFFTDKYVTYPGDGNKF